MTFTKARALSVQTKRVSPGVATGGATKSSYRLIDLAGSNNNNGLAGRGDMAFFSDGRLQSRVVFDESQSYKA